MFETRNDKLREKLEEKLKGLLILTIVNIVFKGKLSLPSFVGTQPRRGWNLVLIDPHRYWGKDGVSDGAADDNVNCCTFQHFSTFYIKTENKRRVVLLRASSPLIHFKIRNTAVDSSCVMQTLRAFLILPVRALSLSHVYFIYSHITAQLAFQQDLLVDNLMLS